MNLSPEEQFAFEQEQERMAALVIKEDRPAIFSSIVTGVDVHYRGDHAEAFAVTIDTSNWHTIAVARKGCRVMFPYIPGLFYLREGPPIVDVLDQVRTNAPVIIDANGILHPRRCGLASYVGVRLERQTIGVAKNLLVGKMEKRHRNRAMIRDRDELIGAAIWLEGSKNPIYVSVGHRISLESAIDIVISSSRGDYPEPVLQAHRLAKENVRE
jgi:deoxyribonuclease V